MGTFLFKTFIKSYEDIKDPEVREKYGQLAGVIGIISNIILCSMKVIIGISIKSIAVIADGINNLADASSSIITLIGFKLAIRPEDEEHPYGHARIEYITGLIISVIIIILGLQLLKTSVMKVIHPDPVQFNYITIIILVIAILIKIWQALFNISAGKRINSVALMATGADSKNDVISTSAVLISVIVGKLTGLQLDGIMGCIVALFIVWSGIQLIGETSSPLLGEAPDPDLVSSIVEGVKAYDKVLGTHDLIVHNYGPGRIFASVHIEVDCESNIIEVHDMIDNIEKTLSNKLKIHLTAHMDPIKVNDPLTDKVKSIIQKILIPLDGVFGLHDLRVVPGPTHTNIIFDAVISPECKLKKNEIIDIVNKEIKKVNENYYVVITFDNFYTKIQ